MVVWSLMGTPTEEMEMDNRVRAIRADAKIGEGTCTTVSEAWTDEELVAELDTEGITQARKAVTYFRAYERLMNDIAADIRGA